MKRMLIQESERNEILSMHNAIKEQTETPKATGEISPELGLLRKAINAGCLKNGKILSNKDLTKYVYRATTKSGKQVDFFADMTYKFSDGVGGKWKCDKMTQISAAEISTNANNTSKIASLKKEGWETLGELKAKGVNLTTLDKVYDTQTVGNVTLYKMKGIVNDLTPGNSTQQFNDEQQSFIDMYEKKGYELNPDRVKRNSMTQVTAEELGAPADLFPNGLILYYNPNKQHGINANDATVLGDILANQQIDREACRKNVTDFYTSFKQKNSFVGDPSIVYKAKKVVQACKDQYYPKKWGILGGGNKLNNYIEILSGDVDGGPSTQGKDKIWRLN